MITESQPGPRLGVRAQPRSGCGNNAELMPQLPSGHVDGIDVTVVRNPSTQVDDVERGAYDWMQNPPPADRYRRGQEQVRGHPVPQL